MQPIILDLETLALPDAETYLEPVAAPSNYKDEAKIAAYIAEERARQLDKAALDVDLNQIIALGFQHGSAAPSILTAEHYSEQTMLVEFWDIWNHYVKTGAPQLVTFNGLDFDIEVLLRRSLYLGITAPFIQTDRFRHPQVIDLMKVLSKDGKLKLRGLNFYLARFGYPGAGQDVTGKDIASLYAAKDWAAIAQHCLMDVEATRWLAQRIGAIPKTQDVAVGAF